MRVHVTRLPRPNVQQPIEVQEGATVQDVLRRLEIPPDAVLVLRREEPVPLDAPTHEGDQLRVINVYSGG